MPFHSGIFCTSFPIYATRGAVPLSRVSRNLVREIKADGRIRYADQSMPAIAYMAKRLAAHRETNLVVQQCFAGEIVAVPIPRSTPTPPKQPDSLWPAMRICEEVQKVGLVKDIQLLLFVSRLLQSLRRRLHHSVRRCVSTTRQSSSSWRPRDLRKHLCQ